MRTTLLLILPVLFAFTVGLGSCSTSPGGDHEKAALREEVQGTIQIFKFRGAHIERFFEGAYGYAVFPSIGKGGIGIGGAYGRGEVYEQGRFIGYCDMTQATIGLQLGGQAYREVIFFQNVATFERFKSGNFAFAAGASAVAVEAGASTTADYSNGVAAFTMAKAGVMGEAAIGGQKFSFLPSP